MQANAVEYFEIDTSRPLRQQLAGKVIVEHPIFLVLLPSELPGYKLVAAAAATTPSAAGGDAAPTVAAASAGGAAGADGAAVAASTAAGGAQLDAHPAPTLAAAAAPAWPS